MFHPPEGLQAWPLLLPPENLSKVVIVDKIDLSALTTPLVQAQRVSPDQATALSIALLPELDPEVDQAQTGEGDVVPSGAPSFALNPLTSSSQGINQLQLVDPPADQLTVSTDSSAQSSVIYATVLLCDPKQEQQPNHLHYKDSSGSSSSDEGNFSANNSDISGSFPGGLWELDDPRRSRSYNSVEELSETSEQEDEEEVRGEKDLCYLRMDDIGTDSEEKTEQSEIETNTELLKNVVLNREGCSVESHPLLGPEDLNELPSVSVCGFSPFYLPQFRTARSMRHLADQVQDNTPPLWCKDCI